MIRATGGVWRTLTAAVGVWALFLAGAASSPALAQKPLNVVATTSMIADALRQVGGERVRVMALMGPGVDPHTYRQTRSDIVAMTKADAVFWHGLYLEAQLEEFFQELGKRKVVIAVAEALPKEQLLDNSAYAGRYDPHVWMDPKMWKGVVAATRDALVKLDPKSAEMFNANMQRHLAEIDALNAYAAKSLATVPNGSRVLITAHDAFNYFGRAYGFQVRGLQGISTATEAGTGDVQSLADFIAERQIPAIFVESSVPRRTIQALQEAVRARGFDVKIGGELFSDAMGNPDTEEGTYIGMVRHNIDTITGALLAESP